MFYGVVTGAGPIAEPITVGPVRPKVESIVGGMKALEIR